MEDRCQQFHVDAQKPLNKNTVKEIDRLRKFLYKNQEHRFTEREQSHLFQAVQCHVTTALGAPLPGAAGAAGAGSSKPAAAAAAGDGEDDSPALQLLEDALKMPFTVFTTSQKKTMLKWLDKLRGAGEAGGGSGGSGSAANNTSWTVIDVNDSAVSVMDDDGNVIDVPLASLDKEQASRIRAVFDDGGEVRVKLQPGDSARISEVLTPL